MNDKIDMASPNLVSRNIEQIATLFPNCVTETIEGKFIDFDLLKQELSRNIVEGTKERYRLEWPGKKEAIVTANLPTTKTLRPLREDSVDFDNTENTYIEGDNLEVLKLLQESYLGKIKMIYIDPPYNTGNDFVYKDNFTQDSNEFKEESGQVDEYNQRLVVNVETSGRYHSDWLSMMYPRLKLARNLLTDDGIIFIAIDDNEIHNLRKICEEIFGERNFLGQISRATGTPTGQGTTGMVSELDYMLVFAKSSDAAFKGLAFTSDDEKIYNQEDEHGRYLTRPLRKTGGEDKREDRPSMYYPLVAPNGSKVYPIGPGGYESRWRCSESTYKEYVKNNLIAWKESDDDGVKSWKPYLKFYLEGRSKAVSNLWTNIDGNKKASTDIKKLLGDKYFDYPKPVGVIERCITVSTNEDDIVLDFFSGSGTTAHAVMRLNADQKVSRRFIVVQIPEAIDPESAAFKAGYRSICDIGKERIRRAAKKIKEETGADIDYGFRVYRLDESNMKDVYYRPQDYQQSNLDLFADNVKSDRTGDDLLAQVMLDWGLPLTLKIEQLTVSGKQVFKVAENSLMACFDRGLDETFAKEIAKYAPMRVIFRDASFKDDTAKENVKQLLRQLSPETEMRVI
jgi:adenine-specific DNA-methyltransferase